MLALQSCSCDGHFSADCLAQAICSLAGQLAVVADGNGGQHESSSHMPNMCSRVQLGQHVQQQMPARANVPCKPGCSCKCCAAHGAPGQPDNRLSRSIHTTTMSLAVCPAAHLVPQTACISSTAVVAMQHGELFRMGTSIRVSLHCWLAMPSISCGGGPENFSRHKISASPCCYCY